MEKQEEKQKEKTPTTLPNLLHLGQRHIFRLSSVVVLAEAFAQFKKYTTSSSFPSRVLAKPDK